MMSQCVRPRTATRIVSGLRPGREFADAHLCNAACRSGLEQSHEPVPRAAAARRPAQLREIVRAAGISLCPFVVRWRRGVEVGRDWVNIDDEGLQMADMLDGL